MTSVKFVPMSVELVDSMGDDDSIVNAARVSFYKQAAEYTKEQNERLLNFLAREHHWSPYAHTALTVRCKVPLYLAAQLKKHQVGLTWNEVSRRYVTTAIEFYDNQDWHHVPDNKKQGRGNEVTEATKHKAVMGYQNSCLAALGGYMYLTEKLNIAPEEARAVLPQATMTEFVWTGSLMAFVRVIKQRSEPGAQLIAQQFAALLADAIKDTYPKAYKVLMES